MYKVMFAFIAALLCATSAVAQQDCALKQVASLPITTTASGKIAVPVNIDGVDRLFLVEMNSSKTGLNANFVKEQNLETGPLPNPPVSSDAEAAPFDVAHHFQDPELTDNTVAILSREVTVPDFKMGALDLHDLKMLLLPGWKSSEGIVGVLGTQLLRNFDLEFDFKNAKMNVFSQQHCDGQAVYWAGAFAAVPIVVNKATGEVLSKLTIDGKPVVASYATTMSQSEMARDVATKIFGITLSSPGITKSPPRQGSNSDWYRYPFASLSLNGLSLQNPAIDLREEDDYCSAIKLQGDSSANLFAMDEQACVTDLYIGLSELRKLHLYFAFGEKKLYVTAADAHK